MFDAVDPKRLGRFWEAALGCETLTDDPGGFETRLSMAGDAFLDLCFQPVAEPSSEPQRLHLDLRGGSEQEAVVQRLLGLGARYADVGQGAVPWVVLADVEDNPFCVMESRAVYANTGPIAAIPIDCADPKREAAFWSWLTGWNETPGSAPRALRHESMSGPLLEFCPEPVGKGSGKNRMHLDVRLEDDDDPERVSAGIAQRGGRELHPGWGSLPWKIYADPSGNEFCVLPAN